MSTYDLLVIGSGPAGQRAAVQGAKLGRRVALVEQGRLGGTSTNTGTVPSKALRAAILELGAPQRSPGVTLQDLSWRTGQVKESERDVIRDQLRRNGVDLIAGRAAFVDPSTLLVAGDDGTRRVSASRFVIAVGSVPARPAGVDFDGTAVIDSDGLPGLRRVPRSLTVVGAGVIGLECALMAAALGTWVTVVDRRPRILDFVDDEIAAALRHHLRGRGVTFRLHERVERVERVAGDWTLTWLQSGKQIPSEVVLYTAGRHGATAGLNLAAAGLQADERGRLSVDHRFSDRAAAHPGRRRRDRLREPGGHRDGAGPAGDARGVRRALGRDPHLLPYGIYTIPELSCVGRTERELTAESVPYVAGLARYRELSRGAIAGDRAEMLKLLVHPGHRRLLGVHAFGSAATELIHIGQAVIAGGLPVHHLVEVVFNVPTFADAYRVAALDAVNRLGELATPDALEITA